LFPVENDGFYGLLSANMEQNPRVYDLSVFVSFADGSRGSLNTHVEVVTGQFIRQDITIQSDRAYLIDPQVERDEIARLESIFSNHTADHLWDASGFTYPINSELTSPFGAYRTLNATVQTRHTGWDMRAVLGTPIMTIAAGRVAFAGALDIRGNYVMIDHGYGIYSGYAHLSQIHVTRGQTVTSGQIIGVSGDTGRGNGPHLHWEMAVNGMWVDSVDFLDLWLPNFGS
jgi:murein DD-endopeptidase MepM/ murein hydrolase activator NlpD